MSMMYTGSQYCMQLLLLHNIISASPENLVFFFFTWSTNSYLALAIYRFPIIGGQMDLFFIYVTNVSFWNYNSRPSGNLVNTIRFLDGHFFPLIDSRICVCSIPVFSLLGYSGKRTPAILKEVDYQPEVQ